jgi:murein tripeptide amidase MpaA
VYKLIRTVESKSSDKPVHKNGYSNNCTVTSLGKTIAGNEIEAISLGTKGKPLLLLMARAHPSETVSSFVVEGVIKMLLSGAPESRFLLSQTRIVIFPMLNPDGVIHGNSRTSYAGCDLNRRWLKPAK